MAFTQRLFRTPLLIPTSLLAISAYGFSEVRADEGMRPGRNLLGDKLPIYPIPTQLPQVQLIENPSPLVPYIAQAREVGTEAVGSVLGVLRDGVGRWIGFERRVEHEIKSILPSDEPLTPGILYILISGLSGTVLTRTRSFPIRWLTPPLFTLIATPLFLPKTAHNIRSYLSKVEDHYTPDLARSHDQLNRSVAVHWNQVRDRMGRVGEDARGLGDGVVRQIEGRTALRVGDLVGGGEGGSKRGAGVVGNVKRGSGQKLETIGYVVEQVPVAEVVRPVEVKEDQRRAV